MTIWAGDVHSVSPRHSSHLSLAAGDSAGLPTFSCQSLGCGGFLLHWITPSSADSFKSGQQYLSRRCMVSTPSLLVPGTVCYILMTIAQTPEVLRRFRFACRFHCWPRYTCIPWLGRIYPLKSSPEWSCPSLCLFRGGRDEQGKETLTASDKTESPIHSQMSLFYPLCALVNYKLYASYPNLIFHTCQHDRVYLLNVIIPTSKAIQVSSKQCILKSHSCGNNEPHQETTESWTRSPTYPSLHCSKQMMHWSYTSNSRQGRW